MLRSSSLSRGSHIEYRRRAIRVLLLGATCSVAACDIAPPNNGTLMSMGTQAGASGASVAAGALSSNGGATFGSGGSSPSGGVGALGGAGGVPASAAIAGTMGTLGGGGGAWNDTPSGGATAGGGNGAAGTLLGGAGSPPAPLGACATEVVGSCDTPTVRITEINVPTSVIGDGGEADTAPIPLAIAPIPSGGSRIAWMSNDGNVYVGELNCDDMLIGTPLAFPAHDFQDLAADDTGGVIALTRDATGGGTLNCGDATQLCVAPDAPVPCYDMHLVRFDRAGAETWDTILTSANAATPPYSAGTGQNYFIWWYQHHARIAFDGTNWATYFADAITVANGSCVDIHEGDRMQVVDAAGGLVDGMGSFALGCSHSWNTRIVWDDAVGEFVMVCATDNENRIARPNPYRTLFPTPDVGTSSVGDLVLAEGGGYWVSTSHAGTLRLLHFSDAEPDQDIVIAEADFSHLVRYAGNRMLLTYESDSGMTAEVRDARDGSSIGPAFTIQVPDHRYQAFKAFPDGSAAYPVAGTDPNSVRIARVMSCQ